jgi:hypothetical protein
VTVVRFPDGTVVDNGTGDVSIREVPTGAICAKVYKTAYQNNIGTGWVQVTFDAAEFDTDGFFDNAGDRLLVPAHLTGPRKYLVCGIIALEGGPTPCIGGIYKNGSIAEYVGRGILDDSDDNYVSFAVPMVLSPGDDIELWVTGSSTVDVRGAAGFTSLSIYLLGSGNVAGLDTARAVRTSGNLTLNSTSWANVDTGLDLVVPAQAGDVLLVSLSCDWGGGEAVTAALDACTLVSGSPVAYVSGGGGASDYGVQGWIGHSNDPVVGAGGAIQYVVQAGDISGGSVTLRLRYRTGSAANKTLMATTAQPIHWSVVNLRGGAASRDIGYEFAYAAVTSDVTVSATSSATANTVVTAPAVVFDGNTVVMLEAFAYGVEVPAGAQVLVDFYDGSSSIGIVGQFSFSGSATERAPLNGRLRLTPTAGSHTYSVRAWRTGSNGVVKADVGGAGTGVPGYIRITKAC